MPLDQQRILVAAFQVLNDVGLEGLTLRRLASSLRVQAPAIYWHFKNKQALLDEMATEVLRRAVRASAHLNDLHDWRAWTDSYYRELRRTLLEYRDGAKMFSGTYLTDADLFVPMEVNLNRMVKAGFTLRQAVVGLSTLYGYTIGFVIEEQAIQLVPGEPNPQYSLAEREARVNKELNPLAAAAGAELFCRLDERFGDGLKLIIDGMALQLNQSGSAH